MYIKKNVRVARQEAINEACDTMPVITYSELKTIADTGDILLFSGNGLFSIAEEVFTNSIYSHVGMLYKSLENGNLYNWESTRTVKMMDILTKTEKNGPRLIELDVSIKKYLIHGNLVVYRKLLTPYDPKTHTGGSRRNMTKEEELLLLEWMRKETKKKYEEKLWELPEAYTRCTILPRSADPSSVFCSEEVAETWKFMNMPINRNSDFYCPQDFSEKHEDLWTAEQKVMGYKLTREYRIEL